MRLSHEPSAAPAEVGGYVAIGGGGDRETVAAAGLYGQWNRAGLCPGVDLRLQGIEGHLHGALVGPRIAYRPRNGFRVFRPYAEALFGPNEFPHAGTNLAPNPMSYRGITSAGVIGIDGDVSELFRWRIVEFTQESFNGRAGVQPYTITTGIVLHLP